MSSELTYDDFLDKLSIQEVLVDAGYHLNKRDGLRYPSYVRTDSEGRRVRGDKFIVTQNGKCCFQPPQQKVYNVISFIKEHPEMFSENKAGMAPDRLVNLVCNRLLNQPIEDSQADQPQQSTPVLQVYTVQQKTVEQERFMVCSMVFRVCYRKDTSTLVIISKTILSQNF